MDFIQTKFSRKSWLVWSFAVFILAVSGSGIMMLHHWCAASLRVVNLLARVESQANRLSALEWQAMAHRSLSAELRREERALRQQLAEVFTELAGHVDARELATVRDGFHDYSRAIDEEFRLLDNKRFAEALRADEERVDPAHDRLVELIQQAQERYETSSQWIVMAANFGSFGVLFAAVLAMGILFARSEKLRRVRQVLLVEQAMLRKSEERFRALVHNTSDIIAILNALPPTIKFVSDSIARILGYRPTMLIGSNFTELVHSDDLGKLQRFIAACAYSSGSTHTTELRMQHVNSNWVIVEIFGDNRSDDSAIGGIVLNIHDVSERSAINADFTQDDFEIDSGERKLH